LLLTQGQILRQEKIKSETYRSDITKLTNSKVELKNQLTLYSDKFDHFQDALTRSQKMFLQFEEKMVTMEQTVEKLENMNQKLKSDCHGYDIELLSQLDLKEKGIKQYDLLQRQKKLLGDDCRILQSKRTELTNRLNELLAELEKKNEERRGETETEGELKSCEEIEEKKIEA
jgi:chromosome segregation ATPase